jgi:hypothetical protein
MPPPKFGWNASTIGNPSRGSASAVPTIVASPRPLTAMPFAMSRPCAPKYVE